MMREGERGNDDGEIVTISTATAAATATSNKFPAKVNNNQQQKKTNKQTPLGGPLPPSVPEVLLELYGE